jgi:hypothetical protein
MRRGDVRLERRDLDGPVAWKLRPDLTRNIATPASFPFDVWPWQFIPKMIETGAMIRSKVAKKCRFRRIGEIHSRMAAHYADARMPFLAMR